MVSTYNPRLDTAQAPTRKRPPSVFPIVRRPPSVFPASIRPPSVFTATTIRPPSVVDAMIEESELVDCAGAAEVLATTIEHVEELIKLRRITHYEVDGQMLFDRSDLQAWLTKHGGTRAKPSRLS